jgi:hypothetical protein
MLLFQLTQNFPGTIAQTIVHVNQFDVQRNRSTTVRKVLRRPAKLVIGSAHDASTIAVLGAAALAHSSSAMASLSGGFTPWTGRAGKPESSSS